MTFDPEADWTAIEPGVIVLPTTGYEIRHNRQTNTYQIRWSETSLGESATLTYAKMAVRDYMRDMLTMGWEP